MGDMELQIFADRLKQLRTELGLTQAQFVNDLGITASALSAYEKNLKNPSISVAKRIADKYHISIDWLCGLSDKKNITEKLETYSDLYKILIEMERRVEICFQTIDFYITGYDGPEKAYTQAFYFNNTQIQNFIEEWEKMKTLHDNKTIDDDVYNLWVEKILTKTENACCKLDGNVRILDDELPF